LQLLLLALLQVLLLQQAIGQLLLLVPLANCRMRRVAEWRIAGTVQRIRALLRFTISSRLLCKLMQFCLFLAARSLGSAINRRKIL